MSRRSGATGVMYLNSALLTNSNWSDTGWGEMTSVKDVTFGGEMGTADVSARGSIWRQFVPTLIDGTVEISIPWDDDDTDLDALRVACLARAQIAIAVLSDSLANDGQGPFGNWYVTKFERPEPLEDAMMANVTLVPAEFTNWKETGS